MLNIQEHFFLNLKGYNILFVYKLYNFKEQYSHANIILISPVMICVFWFRIIWVTAHCLTSPCCGFHWNKNKNSTLAHGTDCTRPSFRDLGIVKGTNKFLLLFHRRLCFRNTC